jgi:hypothetical protein
VTADQASIESPEAHLPPGDTIQHDDGAYKPLVSNAPTSASKFLSPKKIKH